MDKAASMFERGIGSPSIEDLFREIRNDNGLTPGQRTAYLMQLNSAVGNMPKSTPLGRIASLLFGGTVANIIAKYFGMGGVGRTLASFAGAGIGRVIYNQTRDQGIPGWTSY